MSEVVVWQEESVSPWRLPAFRFLLAGGLVSLGADRVLVLPIVVWVQQTHGALFTVLVVLAYAVGWLAAPVTGWLADRFSRRLLCVASRAAGVFIVLPLLFVGPQRVWLVFVVAVFYGLAAVVFATAGAALSADVPAQPGNVPAQPGNVPAQQGRARANAILVGCGQAVAVISLTGGGVFLSSLTVPALIASVSFGISAVLLWFLPSGKSPAPRRLTFGDAVAGLRCVAGSLAPRRIWIGVAVMYAAIGVVESLLFDSVVHSAYESDFLVFLLLLLQGVGALVATVCGRWVAQRGPLPVMRLAAVGCAVATLLLRSSSFGGMVVGCLLLGAASAVLSVSLLTYLQGIAPAPQRGRVMAAVAALVALPRVLLVVATGLLGAFPAVMLGRVGAEIIAVLLLAGPLLWRRMMRRGAAGDPATFG